MRERKKTGGKGNTNLTDDFLRQLKEFNFDDDDIIEVYSDNQLIYSGKYVDIPEDLTLYAVQKKLRIYDVVVVDI